MKIKQGYILRRVMDNNVVVAIGAASKNFNKMVRLNDTAAEIWKLIESGKQESEIVDHLANIYDADRDAIASDVADTLRIFSEQGFLEV